MKLPSGKSSATCLRQVLGRPGAAAKQKSKQKDKQVDGILPSFVRFSGAAVMRSAAATQKPNERSAAATHKPNQSRDNNRMDEIAAATHEPNELGRQRIGQIVKSAAATHKPNEVWKPNQI